MSGKKNSMQKSSDVQGNEIEGQEDTFFERAFFGMFQILENGMFLKVNTALSEMLGYDSLQDLINSTSNDSRQIFLSQEKYTKAINKSIDTDDWIKTEFQCLCKDGNNINTNFSLRRVLKANGTIDYLEGVSQKNSDSKQKDKEVSESENKYRSLFEHSPDGILILDKDSNILEVNERFCFMLGYGKEELQLLNAASLIHPEDLAGKNNSRAMEEILEGKTIQSQYRLRKKEGDYLSIELSTRMLDANQFLNVVRDISLRIKIEEELNETERNYELLIQNIPQKIFSKDRDSKYISCNENFSNDLGISKDEIIGKTDFDFFPKELAEKYRDDDLRIMKSGKSEGIEEQYFTKGVDYWIYTIKAPIQNKSGEVLGIMGLFSDITERKLAEESILTQYYTLKGINESIGSPLFSINRNYQYTSFNSVHAEVMKSLYGVEIDIGKNLLDYMTVKEDSIKAKQNIDKALQGEFVLEETYAGDDLLSRLYYEISHNPIKGKEGEIVGVAVLSRNLSERKKLEIEAKNSQEETLRLLESEEKSASILLSVLEDEKIAREEIKKLNQELEQKVLERTAQLNAINKELETFTYSVSHDLKAPLRGIDGYSKLLQDSYKNELDGEANIFLKNIRDSSFRMNQLIDDLLEYSRLERSQFLFEKINIEELLNSIISSYKEELEEGGFNVLVSLNNVNIFTDSKGLTIALRNLIENAIKFTNGREKPTISVALDENNSFWILSVKYNGIGFDKKFYSKVFDIFQRLHRAEDYPGTGIGLAMVYKAMHRMKGNVRVESQPDIGSTFYLDIPKTN